MALRELRINDVVIVRQARLETGDGFTVLTGETGAGKSICMSALRLVTGARPDGDVVAAGADRARITAVFDAVDESITARLDAAGVTIADDGIVTLSREFAREGRSTCRIDGALVSQALLRDIGEALVDITRQGASHRLVNSIWQRSTLDTFGGERLASARAVVARCVADWRGALADLESARHRASRTVHEIENARALIAELGTMDLRDGEDAELADERLRLRNAAGIAAATRGVYAAVNGDGGALDVVGGAVAQLDDVVRGIAGLEDLLDVSVAAVEQLRELATAARTASEAVVDDPDRLGVVEARLDVIARQKRRFGSVVAALDALDAAHLLVESADGGASDVATLEAAVDAAHAELVSAASALSASRAAAAVKLEAAVGRELAGLDLAAARFRIVIERRADPDGIEVDGARLRCTAAGIDDVEFRLSANPDVAPAPLDAGASGGELSRLALAISSVVADDTTTLVLDEVDTGVGGETAAHVGAVLARIGTHRQVIAVTHRPEIAARAAGHLLATKSVVDGVTVSRVERIEGGQRIDEIARLMSGRLTDAARRRATELIEEGGAVTTPTVAVRGRRTAASGVQAANRS